MKRVTRIELATEAWEASVLPLNYTRIFSDEPSILLFQKDDKSFLEKNYGFIYTIFLTKK